MTRVTVVNPVGRALAHYSRELTEILAGLGHEVDLVSIDEPSARGGGSINRLRWGFQMVRGTITAGNGKRPGLVISVWPAFGYWDVALLALSRADRRVLIVHDPEPLVKAVGHGRLARWVARRLGGRVELMVHGEDALHVVEDRHRLVNVARVEHPMLSPEPARGERATDQRREPVVRVLGQFKSDRDLGALEQIARCGEPGWRLEIVGRGWPEVEGWEVRDEFVTEREFEALLDSADVVPLPYERFFQSGIAIRCLEHGAPFVGHRARSTVNLLGDASDWIVDESDWARAVGAALLTPAGEIDRLAEEAHRRVVASWKNWLRLFGE